MSKKEDALWRWIIRPEYKLTGNKIYRLEDGKWTLLNTFRGPDSNMRAYIHFKQLTKEER